MTEGERVLWAQADKERVKGLEDQGVEGTRAENKVTRRKGKGHTLSTHTHYALTTHTY